MMLKTVTLVSSLLLAASPLALAQTTSSPAPQTPPAATTPGGQPMWYSHQADEMRASKMLGAKVVNTANEIVGDINEVVVGKDGKVVALIVGVGGLLGIGERDVAVSFESVRISRDQNNNLVLTVNATTDALKNAPEWRWDTTKK